jgi:hypothetical protein
VSGRTPRTSSSTSPPAGAAYRAGRRQRPRLNSTGRHQPHQDARQMKRRYGHVGQGVATANGSGSAGEPRGAVVADRTRTTSEAPSARARTHSEEIDRARDEPSLGRLTTRRPKCPLTGRPGRTQPRLSMPSGSPSGATPGTAPLARATGQPTAGRWGAVLLWPTAREVLEGVQAVSPASAYHRAINSGLDVGQSTRGVVCRRVATDGGSAGVSLAIR